ncbi:MAG: 2-amino-4-hydroxy-6-hydroxymethyldihydropteridine diphosphokinase [Pelolinea sp.]|nr:2-amino-4-hydroxy-6-hydroxymethyldihydropteridine diphosphokinase [Pelolinea sp.]
MNEVIILLGSNIQPQKNIKRCLFFLNEKLIISAHSKIWITRSFGSDGPDFLNLAIVAKTPLTTKELKTEVIPKIEDRLGRIRFPDKYAPRTIDLDIIVFNNEIIDTDVWTKVFVAVPISELKPTLVNPENNKALIDIAKNLKSSQQAELFDPPDDFFPI